MQPVQFLANAFINFFGITQPTPRQERVAAWFILGLLIVTFAALAVIATVLFFAVRPAHLHLQPYMAERI